MLDDFNFEDFEEGEEGVDNLIPISPEHAQPTFPENPEEPKEWQVWLKSASDVFLTYWPAMLVIALLVIGYIVHFFDTALGVVLMGGTIFGSLVWKDLEGDDHFPVSYWWLVVTFFFLTAVTLASLIPVIFSATVLLMFGVVVVIDYYLTDLRQQRRRYRVVYMLLGVVLIFSFVFALATLLDKVQFEFYSNNMSLVSKAVGSSADTVAVDISSGDISEANLQEILAGKDREILELQTMLANVSEGTGGGALELLDDEMSAFVAEHPYFPVAYAITDVPGGTTANATASGKPLAWVPTNGADPDIWGVPYVVYGLVPHLDTANLDYTNHHAFQVFPGKSYSASWLYGIFDYYNGDLGEDIGHSAYLQLMWVWQSQDGAIRFHDGVGLWGPTEGSTITITYHLPGGATTCTGHSAEMIPGVQMDMVIENTSSGNAVWAIGAWGEKSNHGILPPECRP